MSNLIKVRFTGTDTAPEGYRHVLRDLTVGKVYEGEAAETGSVDRNGYIRVPIEDGRGPHFSIQDDVGDWVDANLHWGFELVEGVML